MALTTAEIAAIAHAVWASPITKAWDGKDSSAEGVLSSTHFFANSIAINGAIPATATSQAGAATSRATLLAAIAAAPHVDPTPAPSAPTGVVTLVPADIDTIASKVADLLAERMKA